MAHDPRQFEAAMEYDRKQLAEAMRKAIEKGEREGPPKGIEYTVDAPGNPLHGCTLQNGHPVILPSGEKALRFTGVHYRDKDGREHDDIIDVRIAGRHELARQVESLEKEWEAYRQRERQQPKWPLTSDEEDELIHGPS